MAATLVAVPRLAPPGAGIPAIERVVGGAIFAWRRWRGSRERFSAEFVRERGSIANAAGWHAMAAMHMGIHRAQIARILRELAGDRRES